MRKKNEAWEKFLSPEITRDRLISASMFITAFELLKESIIGRIKDFYTNGFDENGFIISPEYQSRVLSRNRSPLYASLDWLIEIGAIEKSDTDTFERLKQVRNQLAHELPALIMGGGSLPLDEHFLSALALLRKIEVWWVVNFEMAIDSELDSCELDQSEILPGPVLMLQLMLDIAAGNSEYLEHYRKATNGRSSNIT